MRKLPRNLDSHASAPYTLVDCFLLLFFGQTVVFVFCYFPRVLHVFDVFAHVCSFDEFVLQVFDGFGTFLYFLMSLKGVSLFLMSVPHTCAAIIKQRANTFQIHQKLRNSSTTYQAVANSSEPC